VLIALYLTTYPSPLAGIGVMGRRPGPGVNKKGCTPKPVNRPKGALALVRVGRRSAPARRLYECRVEQVRFGASEVLQFDAQLIAVYFP